MSFSMSSFSISSFSMSERGLFMFEEQRLQHIDCIKLLSIWNVKCVILGYKQVGTCTYTQVGTSNRIISKVVISTALVHSIQMNENA